MARIYGDKISGKDLKLQQKTSRGFWLSIVPRSTPFDYILGVWIRPPPAEPVPIYREDNEQSFSSNSCTSKNYEEDAGNSILSKTRFMSIDQINQLHLSSCPGSNLIVGTW